MKVNLRLVMVLIATVAVVLATASAFLLWNTMRSDKLVPPVELYKLAVELYKALIAGTVVALLGTLVPLAFKVSRESFEQRKEARHAYSEAKTGVDYLHLRLSTLSLSEAAQLVQSIHVKKHLAETYPELAEYLHGRTIEAWGTDMWTKLNASRQVLEKSGNQWDQLLPQQRLEALRVQ